MATTTTTADGRKPLVKDLHEHIVCPLCRGYLIDATTLVECLHSFCRGCIVRRLGSGARACPVCGAVTLPPLLPDLALQRLVYLAVPGLYRSELERRRHFRLVNPQCPPPAPPLGALSLTLEDAVSLSLCEIMQNDHRDDGVREEDRRRIAAAVTSSKKKKNHHTRHHHHHHHHQNRQEENNDDTPSSNTSCGRRLIRYLKCPAGVTVRHLVRLLALKRGWGDTEGKFTLKNIEMLYQNNINSCNNGEDGEDDDDDDNEDKDKDKDDDEDYDYALKNKNLHRLQLSWTLLDLACIFKWDKETPMKLFYRVVKREEPILQPPSISTYNIVCSNSIVSGNSNGMENVQRPPTPPPSPKQSANSDSIRTQAHLQPSKLKSKTISSLEPETVETEDEKPVSIVETEKSSSSSSSSTSTSSASSASSSSNQLRSNPETVTNTETQNTSVGGETHDAKVKKPRCEVTPVMRAPGFHGSCSPAAVATGASVADNNNRTTGKVPRMEHHKRRKRRNKRLIAEITTTPREDLLKLKVRLTPCPPRITSSTGGSAKEKLLQMRAVRREKIKNNTDRSQTPPPPPPPPPPPAPAPQQVVTTVDNSPEMPLTPPPSASAENINTATSPVIVAVKTSDENVAKKTAKVLEIVVAEQEETIEEIIDGIPDEVVRVAQNLNCPATTAAAAAAATKTEDNKGQIKVALEELRKKEKFNEVKKQEDKRVPEVEIISDEEEEEDDEEDEEEEDKPKKDEEVLRRLGLVAISEASKTLQDKIRGSQKSGGNGSGAGIDYNRESLERQLRESKANRVRSLLAEKQMRDALKSIMSKSKTTKGTNNNGPKKGPPPLAPLTPKQGFSNPPKSIHPVNHPQIQIAGRGSTASGKIEKPLDLSSGANNALDLSPATPSSSVNPPPVITSTTFSSPVSKTRGKSGGGGGSAGQQAGKSAEEKKNQDLNLRTLSDAAVSLLGTNGPTSAAEVRITNSGILSNKVALRIPQPHNRISSFGNGMKIKPNLAVRHIPNPQAFVASQYVRNQRTNFFNVQQQQQQQQQPP